MAAVLTIIPMAGIDICIHHIYVSHCRYFLSKVITYDYVQSFPHAILLLPVPYPANGMIFCIFMYCSSYMRSTRVF